MSVKGVIEAEAKFRVPCDSIESYQAKIEGLGFAFRGEYVQSDVYYQHPCKDFAESGEVLRVRLDEEGWKLTYKSPAELGEVKLRREIEARTGGEIAGILESLGFKPAIKVTKRRIKFSSSEGESISIDSVEGLGCFVEIEVNREDHDRVLQLARLLGLDPKERILKSYAELLLGSAREG